MSSLLSEFICNIFNSYIYFSYELEEIEIDYDSIYTEDPNKEDDWGDYEYQLSYGITKYYTKDDARNLICIEHHHGHEDNSEYNFTQFGFDYYKKFILEFINLKMEESNIKLKNQRIMDAYNSSEEEWAEVYKRLADS